MAEDLKIKPCKRCATPFTAMGKQTVCPKCVRENHKKACLNWQAAQKQGWRKKYEQRGGNNKRDYNRREAKQSLTFEFTEGKWYWRAGNGLTNGPFDTIRAARKDANTAL